MANLVRVTSSPLTQVISNHVEAGLTVAATSYFVGCILLFHKEGEFNKKELVAEVVSAGYACWKWKMGLGSEPPVNIGIPNEIPSRKELTEGRHHCSQERQSTP